ncbi:MAG: HEAT repeat domain-containing protein [Anaerolineae bacterium]|jgi:HEAT repeat protein
MRNRGQRFLALAAGGDDAQTLEAARALSEIGEEALPALRKLLEDPDPHRRWWAPRALALIGTDAAISLLISSLDDTDADVRACAVLALSGLRPDVAADALVERLSDSSAYVSRLAADALSQFGQCAVPSLIKALEEGDAAARAGAARALAAIQPEEAVRVLCEALDDPSAFVSHYAKEALDKMGVGTVLLRP